MDNSEIHNATGKKNKKKQNLKRWDFAVCMTLDTVYLIAMGEKTQTTGQRSEMTMPPYFRDYVRELFTAFALTLPNFSTLPSNNGVKDHSEHSGQ